MKLTGRVAALALTMFAVAGTLGAQNRGRSAPRQGGSRQAAPRQAATRQAAPRQAAPRAQFDNRVRVDMRAHAVAARPEVRARPETRARADVRGYQDLRARTDFRGNPGFRGPVDHGRPLITRAGAYREVRYGGGFRYWRGVDRFGARIVLPLGWYRPLYVNGFFPEAYFGYCDAVPYDLNYMMPPMYDGYDSCLIGDRIIVYNRFTRGISFVAVVP